MRTPLRKRLPHRLCAEMGKYVVIFLLLSGTISFVSGFLVAGGSMLAAYHESFDRYRIEDGNMTLEEPVNKAQKKRMKQWGICLYDLFFVEEGMDNGSTLRIFSNRESIDLPCVMEGRLPEEAGEIAIDRMYADNNRIAVGDRIANGIREWEVTGLIALPDYSALFANNDDSMFDASLFGVALVAPEEFASYGKKELNYRYAWKYIEEGQEKELRERAEELRRRVNEELMLRDFTPEYDNQAIRFTGTDLGSDRTMILVLLYIIMGIMAFVFAVITGDTIRRESAVIGTLRAMGYTRGELLGHYMSLPVWVTLWGALTGNALGYTFFCRVSAGLYYASYSLPTYEARWNGEAFWLTTVVPVAMMALINGGMLGRSLGYSPLQFIKNEIGRISRGKPFPLAVGIPFFNRFGLRILLQNGGSYLLLFLGILFANLLLMFGTTLPPALTHYQETMEDSMLAEYQYILRYPGETEDETHRLRALMAAWEFRKGVETQDAQAEAFGLYPLTAQIGTGRRDEILLYGIDRESRYVKLPELGDGVAVSSAFANKYMLEEGDWVTLKEEYEETEYRFRVSYIYHYEGGLGVFMPIDRLNEIFELGEGAFGGYFSHRPLTDIGEQYISTVIDLETLTKVSRQLDISMGGITAWINGFSMIMFMTVIYLLSKVMIEKNARAISMIKILGYNNGEIGRLYIISTFIMVVAFVLLSLPVETEVMKYLFRTIMMERVSGWIPLYIDPGVYGRIVIMGIATYTAVAGLEYLKIKKIPMEEALKHAE